MEDSYEKQKEAARSEGNEEEQQSEGNARSEQFVEGDKSETSRSEIFHQHDTPPPLIFGDGSCFIEAAVDLDDDVVGGAGGNPKKHRIRPTGNNNRVFFHRLRLLKGNGETIDEWEPSHDCTITITLDDGTQVEMAGGNFFFIQIESDKRLFRVGTPLRHSKRGHFYHHRGNSSQEKNIVRVRINDSDAAHDHDIRLTPGRPQDAEFQIMIWLEEARE